MRMDQRFHMIEDDVIDRLTEFHCWHSPIFDRCFDEFFLDNERIAPRQLSCSGPDICQPLALLKTKLGYNSLLSLIHDLV